MNEERYYLWKQLVRETMQNGGRLRVYFLNGYQMVGKIGNIDEYSFYILDERRKGKKSLVFLHAISTIEEEGTPAKDCFKE